MSEKNAERVTPAYIRAVAEEQVAQYGWLMLLAEEIESLQQQLKASEEKEGQIDWCSIAVGKPPRGCSFIGWHGESWGKFTRPKTQEEDAQFAHMLKTYGITHWCIPAKHQKEPL